MKEEKFRRLRTYMTSWEAEQARNFLESQGIQAFIEGINTQMTLAYAGGSMNGVKLLVAAQDFQLAEQVLANHDDPASSTAWVCHRCYSEVDAGFDICWKCNAERRQASTEQGGEQQSEENTSEDNSLSGDQPPPLASLALEPQLNPLAAPKQGNAIPATGRPCPNWSRDGWILLWGCIEIAALAAYCSLQRVQP